MQFRPYSYSTISLYEKCPRAFKYRKIDRAKTNKTDMTALLKGRAVHDIFEKFPEKSTHKLAEKYSDITKKFIESELGEKYLFRDASKEISFGLTIDLEPCSYSDKTALFRGKIDYVGIVDDVVHVCDWKSGKLQNQRWQSYDQLMYYSIYIFKKFDKIDKINISYVYIDHIDENRLLLERKFLVNYSNSLISVINKLEADESFLKKPSRLCEWCEFNSHCAEDV